MALSTVAEDNEVPIDMQAYAMKIQQKYQEERAKRFRPDGNFQYVEPAKDGKLRNFLKDPWVAHEKHASSSNEAVDGSYSKFLIIGAGFGGLLFAARLIEAGISPSDIRFIDCAGGFGGTWYWNRFPGLMCDVESYIYMPLLEEMNYMPKHKYAFGIELRDYVNAIASKYDLSDKGIFRREVKSMAWDDDKKEWHVSTRAYGTDALDATLNAQFVIMATGLLVSPKLPGVPGVESFNGDIFHTSRWNYDVTGGSPEDPSLPKLKDKSVGIIGTGATAVQAVPVLAKYAKHLHVFQRTPSSVSRRDNRPTDPEEWRTSVANKKGWWRDRNSNFAILLAQSEPLPEVNLVGDEWSKNRAYCALVGWGNPLKHEDVPAHVADLYARDFPYAEAVRARTAAIVKDPETAEKLKHWYPSWCKRPCFHDEYLQAYNEPNVTLVHTDGQSISNITPNGVVVGDKEYPVDVLIMATGYESPAKYIDTPSRAGINVTGRGGINFTQKFSEAGDTLHGVTTRDFPNLFWSGPGQAGATANNVFLLDTLSQHVAYIISTAEKQKPGRITIEPTAEAETAWGYEIAARAAAGAAMVGCTPGYLNAEGALDMVVQLPPEEQMKMAKRGIWGLGLMDYSRVLDEWRNQGNLPGLEVNAF